MSLTQFEAAQNPAPRNNSDLVRWRQALNQPELPEGVLFDTLGGLEKQRGCQLDLKAEVIVFTWQESTEIYTERPRKKVQVERKEGGWVGGYLSSGAGFVPFACPCGGVHQIVENLQERGVYFQCDGVCSKRFPSQGNAAVAPPDDLIKLSNVKVFNRNITRNIY